MAKVDNIFVQNNKIGNDVPQYRVTNPDTGRSRIVTAKSENGWILVGLIVTIIPTVIALYRRDWFGAFVMTLLGVCTFGFSNLIFTFKYNNWYAKRLYDAGYQVDRINSSNFSK